MSKREGERQRERHKRNVDITIEGKMFLVDRTRCVIAHVTLLCIERCVILIKCRKSYLHLTK